MPVSQKQIAEYIGIDPSMVSHALRGDTRVAKATREKVLNAARELGYHSGMNPEARSLAARRHGKRLQTRTIGLVFDHVSIVDEWGLPTYKGLIDGAKSHNYDLLTLLQTPDDWMLDQEELLYMDRRSDGMVFLVPTERTRVLKALVKQNIPAVSCFVDDVPEGVATVVLDNAEAMRITTELVIKAGHTKIVHVAGQPDRSDFKARRVGYQAAMAAARLKPHIVQFPELYNPEGRANLRNLLTERSATAFICGSDDYAHKVMDLAAALGLSAPQDFSLVGMDNVPESTHRNLTTIDFSCLEVGRAAIEAVSTLIDGGDPTECSRIVPVQLIERGSVGPPKSA